MIIKYVSFLIFMALLIIGLNVLKFLASLISITLAFLILLQVGVETIERSES